MTVLLLQQAKNLLALLARAQTNWFTKLQELDTKLRCVNGDALLAGLTKVCLPECPPAVRSTVYMRWTRMLIHENWYTDEDDVATIEDLLSTHDQQETWCRLGLPRDAYLLQSASMAFTASTDVPLVFDPDGYFLSLMEAMSQFSSHKKLSVEDPAFLFRASQALLDGHAVLVVDVDVPIQQQVIAFMDYLSEIRSVYQQRTMHSDHDVKKDREVRAFFITRSPLKGLQLTARKLVRAIGFQATPATIEQRVLLAVLKNQGSALYTQEVSVRATIARLQRDLSETNDKMVQSVIDIDMETVLEDDDLVETLNQCHEHTAQLSEELSQCLQSKATLQEQRTIYQVLSRRGVALYRWISLLEKFHPNYRWALSTYLQLVREQLDHEAAFQRQEEERSTENQSQGENIMTEENTQSNKDFSDVYVSHHEDTHVTEQLNPSELSQSISSLCPDASSGTSHDSPTKDNNGMKAVEPAIHTHLRPDDAIIYTASIGSVMSADGNDVKGSSTTAQDRGLSLSNSGEHNTITSHLNELNSKSNVTLSVSHSSKQQIKQSQKRAKSSRGNSVNSQVKRSPSPVTCDISSRKTSQTMNQQANEVLDLESCCSERGTTECNSGDCSYHVVGMPHRQVLDNCVPQVNNTSKDNSYPIVGSEINPVSRIRSPESELNGINCVLNASASLSQSQLSRSLNITQRESPTPPQASGRSKSTSSLYSACSNLPLHDSHLTAIDNSRKRSVSQTDSMRQDVFGNSAMLAQRIEALTKAVTRTIVNKILRGISGKHVGAALYLLGFVLSDKVADSHCILMGHLYNDAINDCDAHLTAGDSLAHPFDIVQFVSAAGKNIKTLCEDLSYSCNIFPAHHRQSTSISSESQNGDSFFETETFQKEYHPTNSGVLTRSQQFEEASDRTTISERVLDNTHMMSPDHVHDSKHRLPTVLRERLAALHCILKIPHPTLVPEFTSWILLHLKNAKFCGDAEITIETNSSRISGPLPIDMIQQVPLRTGYLIITSLYSESSLAGHTERLIRIALSDFMDLSMLRVSTPSSLISKVYMERGCTQPLVVMEDDSETLPVASWILSQAKDHAGGRNVREIFSRAHPEEWVISNVQNAAIQGDWILLHDVQEYPSLLTRLESMIQIWQARELPRNERPSATARLWIVGNDRHVLPQGFQSKCTRIHLTAIPDFQYRVNALFFGACQDLIKLCNDESITSTTGRGDPRGRGLRTFMGPSSSSRNTRTNALAGAQSGSSGLNMSSPSPSTGFEVSSLRRSHFRGTGTVLSGVSMTGPTTGTIGHAGNSTMSLTATSLVTRLTLQMMDIQNMTASQKQLLMRLLFGICCLHARLELHQLKEQALLRVQKAALNNQINHSESKLDLHSRSEDVNYLNRNTRFNDFGHLPNSALELGSDCYCTQQPLPSFTHVRDFVLSVFLGNPASYNTVAVIIEDVLYPKSNFRVQWDLLCGPHPQQTTGLQVFSDIETVVIDPNTSSRSEYANAISQLPNIVDASRLFAVLSVTPT